MGVVGIDIGIRHFAIAKFDDSGITTHYHEVSKSTRYQELTQLKNLFQEHIHKQDTVWIEEPPIAGSRNLRIGLQLAQTAGALMASSPAPAYFVAVSQWKKAVVGKGNASKDEVNDFVALHFPEYYKKSHKNQNIIDATCIGLYGCEIA